MIKYLYTVLIVFIPSMISAHDSDDVEIITIRPIGVDYSKYAGTNKLFMVGECKGLPGNQVVIFQNRPSFDYFENDHRYTEEQKELEKAIWSEILDSDDEPMILKGRWHQYQDRTVFLCHQIMQMNKYRQKVQ